MENMQSQTEFLIKLFVFFGGIISSYFLLKNGLTQQSERQTADHKKIEELSTCFDNYRERITTAEGTIRVHDEKIKNSEENINTLLDKFDKHIEKG